jgi:DNA-binding GntR family transcriptional regulator
MPQSSPRGHYLEVAEALRQRIAADPELTELPPVETLQAEYDGISRMLLNRALRQLRTEGLLTSDEPERWLVVRTPS